MLVHVELVPATEAHRPIMRALLQLYLYDFSEFDGRDVDEHGEYGYRYLDHYWTDPDRAPFLIAVDDRWAGLALIRIGDPNDVSEFFVMRKYRMQGVGRVAARLLFERIGGLWTVRELRSNEGAIAFWRAVIPYPFTEVVRADEVIQQFETDA